MSLTSPLKLAAPAAPVLRDTGGRVVPLRPARPAPEPPWTWLSRRFNPEGLVVLLLLAAAWEVGSRYLPPFLFPSIERVAQAVGDVFAKPESLRAIGQTWSRILIFISLSFAIGTTLGATAGSNARLERTLIPLVQLAQGVPGVCWVIFAIIWFRDMDTRMAFIIVISTLPSFFYQARDGYRAIPRDLWQMVKALRPTRWQMFRTLIAPGLVPAMLTAIRINLGAATKVTITAELLAGNNGIGYFLRNAQEQFRMDTAMAWTLVLVSFVVASDLLLATVEKRLLRWRQAPEREV